MDQDDHVEWDKSDPGCGSFDASKGHYPAPTTESRRDSETRGIAVTRPAAAFSVSQIQQHSPFFDLTTAAARGTGRFAFGKTVAVRQVRSSAERPANEAPPVTFGTG
jgi:hypothetical protein